MIDALRRQFDLAWALADLHLNALTADDFGWEPADLVWTMRRGAHSTWTPDTDRTVADTALWLNVELAKNAAEIGQLRLLRAATR
ncbi:hypothetical protein [Mycobacterium sp. C31M]